MIELTVEVTAVLCGMCEMPVSHHEASQSSSQMPKHCSSDTVSYVSHIQFPAHGCGLTLSDGHLSASVPPTFRIHHQALQTGCVSKSTRFRQCEKTKSDRIGSYCMNVLRQRGTVAPRYKLHVIGTRSTSDNVSAWFYCGHTEFA